MTPREEWLRAGDVPAAVAAWRRTHLVSMAHGYTVWYFFAEEQPPTYCYLASSVSDTALQIPTYWYFASNSVPSCG